MVKPPTTVNLPPILERPGIRIVSMEYFSHTGFRGSVPTPAH